MELPELYLETLKKSLLKWSEIGQNQWKPSKKGPAMWIQPLISIVSSNSEKICKPTQITAAQKMDGKDWQTSALTMIGLKRLNNIHFCIREILKYQIPGDFIETGVWRGGATIFMRGALEAYGDKSRLVWVADSFEGLPKRVPKNTKEIQVDIDPKNLLAVSLDEVKYNFSQFNLLDDRVKFLKGWFKDTLPVAPISQLSLLRLDGDHYESTMDALENLYPKLSPGGFIIIDDFSLEACRNAVNEYREKHGITESINKIDWTGVYWQKKIEI